MDRKLAQKVNDTCFALHARRAARQISRFYDEMLKPVGLTNGQFSLMTMLRIVESCPLNEAAGHLGIDRTTLNATLKPLEREGLVESQTDARDARVRRIGLTDTGRGRLAQAAPLWKQAQARIEARLGDRSGESLRTQLRVLA